MYIYLYIFFLGGGAQNNYGDHNFPPKDFDVLKNFFFSLVNIKHVISK